MGDILSHCLQIGMSIGLTAVLNMQENAPLVLSTRLTQALDAFRDSFKGLDSAVKQVKLCLFVKDF